MVSPTEISEPVSFCTIITASHLAYAETLCKSIEAQTPRFRLFVLVVDQDDLVSDLDSITLMSIDQIQGDVAGQLRAKYLQHGLPDEFRWSMKSQLLLHLLAQGHKKAVFVDPDIAFFADPQFIFDALEQNSVLLTPHWRCHEPDLDPGNFATLQYEGLYNAGFIAVSDGAEEALQWWSRACLYRCEKKIEESLYVDQAYLNLMPVYFEKVTVLRHRGCNVANWNLTLNRRERVANHVLINGEYPIVFIHFTASMIRGILSKHDPLLLPNLKAWLAWQGSSVESARERYLGSTSSPVAEVGVFHRLRSRLNTAKTRLGRLLNRTNSA